MPFQTRPFSLHFVILIIRPVFQFLNGVLLPNEIMQGYHCIYYVALNLKRILRLGGDKLKASLQNTKNPLNCVAQLCMAQIEELFRSLGPLKTVKLCSCFRKSLRP
jgi:hypothetical protein